MEAGNETPEQQVSLQQPFLQDIHAVLREMSASLAVQKEQITALQKENQEHLEKLKEIETLKTEIERQKTEVERQKTETEQLKHQSKDHVAMLKTEMEKLKTEIEQLQLKLQSKVKQVAFSASLLNTGDGDTGPFNTQTTLIFRRVVTNIGNACNPQTGIFTAPVRGVYHFEWHLYGHNNIQTGAELTRNGQKMFTAYEHQPTGCWTSSHGASLLLEVGDQVFVRLFSGARIHDNQDHPTSFSGHLLFTM